DDLPGPPVADLLYGEIEYISILLARVVLVFRLIPHSIGPHFRLRPLRISSLNTFDECRIMYPVRGMTELDYASEVVAHYYKYRKLNRIRQALYDIRYKSNNLDVISNIVLVNFLYPELYFDEVKEPASSKSNHAIRIPYGVSASDAEAAGNADTEIRTGNISTICVLPIT
ncbi:hypothetical protein BX600DRAFT_529106, partial [Xylariales sp. PMI_506]